MEQGGARIQRQLSEGRNRYLLKLETRLKHELREVLDQIETFWIQKSRVEANRDDDRSTQYCHTSTIIRRKFNQIELL